MKIAFVIDTIEMDTAGTQKQLLETIRRLDRSEFEPHLVCLHESSWMRQNSLPCACTVLDYRGFLKPNFPIVVYRLARLIRRLRFDVVQTFFEDSIFVAFLGAIFTSPRPAVISSRRDIGLGRGNQPWYHRLFQVARPFVSRRLTAIVANSAQVKSYVVDRDGVAPAMVWVHYNGVDIPILNECPPAPEPICNYPAAVWVGIVASLTPVKRHDLLLRAFASVHSGVASGSVRLLVVGEGPERNALETLCQRLGIAGHVHFVGATREVGTYLRHLDIGVLCSDREGLSNALLEYMAFGLPVVATDVGGARELVSEGNGLLIPNDDVDALAHSLRVLISDKNLRQSLGRTGRTEVERRFSWDRSIGDLQAFYRSIAPR